MLGSFVSPHDEQVLPHTPHRRSRVSMYRVTGWQYRVGPRAARPTRVAESSTSSAPGVPAVIALAAFALLNRHGPRRLRIRPVREERSTGPGFDNFRRMVVQPSEAAAKKDNP
jgi:hypothetical protein